MIKNTAYLQWVKTKFHGNSANDSIDLIVGSLLSEAKQLAFPVKLSAVAKIIGIDPKPLYIDQPYDGSLIIKEGKLRIALKLDYRENYKFSQRLRFTYAHELIHCLAYDLNNMPNKREAPSPEALEEEYLCNYGAAKLILPRQILSNFFSKKSNYFSSSYSEKIKIIADQADCSISTVAIDLIKSELFLDRIGKIYILSQIGRGYQSKGILKPRCVISVYFDENGKKHTFLGPDKGLEHIRNSDFSPWSLLKFHNDSGYYYEIKNEDLTRTTDGYSFDVTGSHVRLGEKGYIWSELSVVNVYSR